MDFGKRKNAKKVIDGYRCSVGKRKIPNKQFMVVDSLWAKEKCPTSNIILCL
jgi:hypothetical protein